MRFSRQMLLAVLLWAWFTIPLPQILALRARAQNFQAVPLSHASEQGLKTYYAEITLSAVVLSVLGPALIWKTSSQSGFSPARLLYGAAIGFVLSEVAVLIIPVAWAAGEGQGRGHPVNSAYFVCASVLSGF